MSSWFFKRKEKGIQTATEQKKDTLKGFGINRLLEKLLNRCLAKNFYVSPRSQLPCYALGVKNTLKFY